MPNNNKQHQTTFNVEDTQRAEDTFSKRKPKSLPPFRGETEGGSHGETEGGFRLGSLNLMRIARTAPQGVYLEGDATGDVLLPARYVPEGAKVGDEVEVFLYLDQDERIIATTLRPHAMVGDFAYLQVSWVNNFGAFLDWGLMKDLFVPFREQKMKMVKGNSYVVHVHIDRNSGRIMASAKVERYLSAPDDAIAEGQEVEMLVTQKTDLGFKVIIDNRYGGLLYDNEIFTALHTGDRVAGYVKRIRPDGKIDCTLQAKAKEAVRDFADILLEHLGRNGGATHLGDKSDPQEIYALFGVSKKVFKQAIGRLYKEHRIIIADDGIRLAEQAE